ncbi:MAG: hypothetical protein HY741_26395 [Chloroflexi bacterium]|nr:hypothetical protein [Chloroflexota bacterium]
MWSPRNTSNAPVQNHTCASARRAARGVGQRRMGLHHLRDVLKQRDAARIFAAMREIIVQTLGNLPRRVGLPLRRAPLQRGNHFLLQSIQFGTEFDLFAARDVLETANDLRDHKFYMPRAPRVPAAAARQGVRSKTRAAAGAVHTVRPRAIG